MYERDDKVAIESLKEYRGLTTDEATQFLQRERYVAGVREEAEELLGRKLPLEFGSAFIEQFCVLAPAIAVGFLNREVNNQSTMTDWRFLHDITCDAKLNPGAPWFSLNVSKVSEKEPWRLDVELSPGQVLANFAARFEAASRTQEGKERLMASRIEVFNDLLNMISASFDGVVSRVTEGQGDLVSQGETLEGLLRSPALMPPWIPTNLDLHVALLAHDLDDDAAKIVRADKRDESPRETAFALLALIRDRGIVLDLLGKIRELHNALGEGRPIKDGINAEELWSRLTRDGSERDPASMRQVALAYLNGVSTPAVFSSHTIIGEIHNVDFQIGAAEQRLQTAQEAGLAGVAERGIERLSYLQYLREALSTNRDFLVRIFRR